MLSLEKIKNKIIVFLNWFHKLVFKTEASPAVFKFVKNVGYSGFGTVGYTFILFFVNFYVVRFFGPEEYGKYILLFSTFNILSVLMLFGLNTSLVKFLPEAKEDKENQRKIISAGLIGILLFSTLSCLLFYFFQDTFANLLSVPVALFLFALIYSIFAVIKGFFDAIFKGNHEFKKQALLSLVYAVVILVAFFVFNYFFHYKSYLIYIFAIVAGIIFYCLFSFFEFRKLLFPFNFERKTFFKMIDYGFFSSISSLIWLAMGSLNIFFINYFLDIKTVGIFAVYYGASMLITSRALGIFLNVFFPTASGISDKHYINNKLNKLMKIGFLPGIILNMVVIAVMLFVYGDEYPLSLVWISLFSVASILYSYANIKWNLIASINNDSIKYCTKHSLISLVLYLLINYVSIVNFGVIGAVFSMIVSSAYIYFVCEFYLNYEAITIKTTN